MFCAAKSALAGHPNPVCGTMRRMQRASIPLTLSILFCTFGCADQMLLYPSTGPTSAGSAQRREIHDHGRIVEVFIEESPGAKARGVPDAYALEFTGNETRA